MKICVAQTKPFKGDIQKNMEKHKELITAAVACKGDAIFFPELSLTGYEPPLSKSLAANAEDSLFDLFQHLSDFYKITIGVGMPTPKDSGVLISMLIFQPGITRQTYSKQHLHKDEFPYFTEGTNQVLITNDLHKIAPAICYESLLPAHSETACNMGASIYVAGVAKSNGGVEKALSYFPIIARQYSMTVLMANAVGPCDNFISAGKSAVWNTEGTLVGQLDDENEGILLYDTDTKELMIEQFQ